MSDLRKIFNEDDLFQGYKSKGTELDFYKAMSKNIFTSTETLSKLYGMETYYKVNNAFTDIIKCEEYLKQLISLLHEKSREDIANYIALSFNLDDLCKDMVENVINYLELMYE